MGIPFDSISHVEFARLGGTQSNRTFDLVIFMKSTKLVTEKNYIFTSINKDEYQCLEKYLRSRGVTVTGAAAEKVIDAVAILGGDEEESEDDDFSGNQEEEDEEDDLEYDEGGAVPIDAEDLSAVEPDAEDSDIVALSDDDEKPTKKRKKKPSTSSSPQRKKARKAES